MTKLAKIMLIALALGTIGIYFTSCNKSDISETLTDVSEQAESANMNFRVENNTLVFDSFEDYTNTFDYVKTLDRGQLDLWEEEVGFTSARKLYDMALYELELATESEAAKTVENKYKKVVKFTEDYVSPLFSSYYMSTLLNENGILRVGEGLTKHTGDKMINIPDGDIDKLNRALENLEEDRENGIYIHETTVSSTAKNCAFNEYDEIAWTGSRPWYRLSVESKMRNFSTISNGNFWLWYEIDVEYKHRRKKRFSLIWFCERTNVTFDYNYEVTIDFINNFDTDMFLSNSIGPITSGNECTVNNSHTVVLQPVNVDSYFNRSVTLDRRRNNASVTSPKPLATGNSCG